MFWSRKNRGLVHAAVAALAMPVLISLYTPLSAHSDLERPRGVVLSPLFQLLTHKGVRLSRSDLKGKPFIVVFGFTDCPNICPTALLDMTNLLADLGPEADRMKVLFVSVDPERDTPDQLRQYLASFDPRIIGLTGQPVDIAAVAHAFDAAYEKVYDKDGGYTVDHSTRVFFMDRYGLLAAALGPETSARRRSGLIRRLLLQ